MATVVQVVIDGVPDIVAPNLPSALRHAELALTGGRGLPDIETAHPELAHCGLDIGPGFRLALASAAPEAAAVAFHVHDLSATPGRGTAVARRSLSSLASDPCVAVAAAAMRLAADPADWTAIVDRLKRDVASAVDARVDAHPDWRDAVRALCETRDAFGLGTSPELLIRYEHLRPVGYLADRAADAAALILEEVMSRLEPEAAPAAAAS